MNFKKTKKITKNILLIVIIILLNGCCDDMVLFHSKGYIGIQERSLILISLIMMSIIITPVIIMTLVFLNKYKSSNNNKYDPNWNHSNKIEYTIWTLPILSIIFLAIITWISTHKLDPNKPIKSEKETILIQVVSFDWKWLFIYPKYDIATINEIVFPINTPIKFQITSNSVMNSFFIPQLGSQIYAMNGMNSTLYLMANEEGKYKGISANFSGKEFSKMKFFAIATKDKSSFNTWVKKVKNSPDTLNTSKDYKILEKKDTYNVAKYFSKVENELFKNIINKHK
ncbi:Cytochrome bo(3) ubiquinol oxidase subunit 2 [Candidatus Westeberhardia cardiocondylae]|uniref:Ubiquinol oxidase subunit 2 n=1 Tax=Candidatus Westeberhardia cardiocondylae TaxID=1594731 RepID=A0A0H5BX13_9ENTR|nr:ubiquinol oxidase subunit II [Candidatus Westeberhardia cardiocondylae]CEN32129.1 Cytochrome bo(3) ubiquinol oxidase subunit 2 [Candidatus Westeberhardia cardiocondylae]